MTKIAFNAALLCYVLVSTLIAFALPNEGAGAMIFSSFSEAVMAVFPAVREMSAVSEIPAVTSTFYSIQWLLLLPLFLLLMFRVDGFGEILGGRIKILFATLAMTLLIALLIYMLGFKTAFPLPNSSDRGTFFMNAMINYRIGMALIGSLCFFVVALALTLVTRGLRVVF
jgi:hypothetical protein